jgi:hypothetical protein
MTTIELAWSEYMDACDDRSKAEFVGLRRYTASERERLNRECGWALRHAVDCYRGHCRQVGTDPTAEGFAEMTGGSQWAVAAWDNIAAADRQRAAVDAAVRGE